MKNTKIREIKPFETTGLSLQRALRRLAIATLNALWDEYANAWRKGNYITKDQIEYELTYEDHMIRALTEGDINGDKLLLEFRNKCYATYGKFVKGNC